MKMVSISKDGDTAVGLRLSGIESFCIKNDEEIIKKFNEISQVIDIGIIILTNDVYKVVEKQANNIIKTQNIPLIVTIPDI